MNTSNERTMYERNAVECSKIRYHIGLVVCWKQYLKYSRSVSIARKRGVTIGEDVVVPMSLAKQANVNLAIGEYTIKSHFSLCIGN